MYEVTIDPERCVKDGLCAIICPAAIFQQDEKVTIPKISDEYRERCIACGHCMAICRHGAISHSEFSPTAIRAPAAGSTSILIDCSPMAVPTPVWPK